jgi:hypothetical protein
MKRRVVAYFLSAASVYLTISLLTKAFIDLMMNFNLSIM